MTDDIVARMREINMLYADIDAQIDAALKDNAQ